MKQNTFWQLTVLLLLFLLASCGNKTQNAEETGRAGLVQQRNLVQIMELQPSTFTKQLAGNGKLMALQKAELRFRISGEIEQLPVSNGLRIAPGQLIAALNDTEYSHRLQQARLGLQRAQLELHDVLIGMGFSQRPTTADLKMLTHVARGFSLFAQSPQPVPRIGRLMISPPWGFLFTLNNKNSATSKAPPPNNQQSHPRNKTYAQKPPLGGWGYNTAATTSQLFTTPYHGRF